MWAARGTKYDRKTCNGGWLCNFNLLSSLLGPYTPLGLVMFLQLDKCGDAPLITTLGVIVR